MNFSRIILMKYGVHASESVDEIIIRKRKESQIAGHFFWGYGGVICHPLKQVQPFLHECKAKADVFLLLSKTPSQFNNPHQKATSFSRDGMSWEKIPDGIAVYGSKYALDCQELIECDFSLDLSSYLVGIGPSIGRRFSDYIQGRVDKGCGVLDVKEKNNDSCPVRISWYARVSNAYLLR